MPLAEKVVHLPSPYSLIVPLAKPWANMGLSNEDNRGYIVHNGYCDDQRGLRAAAVFS